MRCWTQCLSVTGRTISLTTFICFQAGRAHGTRISATTLAIPCVRRGWLRSCITCGRSRLTDRVQYDSARRMVLSAVHVRPIRFIEDFEPALKVPKPPKHLVLKDIGHCSLGLICYRLLGADVQWLRRVGSRWWWSGLQFRASIWVYVKGFA